MKKLEMPLVEVLLGLLASFVLLLFALRLLLEKLTQKNYEFITYWVKRKTID